MVKFLRRIKRLLEDDPILQWKEPRAVHRRRFQLRFRRLSLGKRLFIATLVMLLLLMLYVIGACAANGKQFSISTMPAIIGFSLLLAFLGEVFVPWAEIGNVIVSVTKWGIVAKVAHPIHLLKYKKTLSYDIVPYDEAEGSWLLALTPSSGRCAILGVPSSVSLEKLEAVLRDQGLWRDAEAARGAVKEFKNTENGDRE